jgi:effector-binding domain-containing protein
MIVIFLLFTTIVAHTTHKHEIEIKEVKGFAYCCIHMTAPYTEIPKVVEKVWPAFQQQGIMPTGPMIGVYLNSPYEVKPEELEWEIGFPVSAETAPQPPLVKKAWEFTHVVSYVFHGPYEKTAEAYPKMMEWVEKNGRTPNGPIMERYLTDPMSEIDPSEYETEIWIPVEKK